MPSFCTGEWKQDLAMRGNDFNWPDAGPAGSQRVFQFASSACFWHITRMMRCLPKWLGVGLCLLAVGRAGNAATPSAGNPQAVLIDGLIARIHFVGMAQLDQDATAKGVRDIAGFPESAQLLDAVMTRLATAPYRFLEGHTASTNDYAPLIRPLLDDLRESEFLLESRDSDHGPETVLAVRLGDARAAAWMTGWKTVLAGWTGIQPAETSSAGYTGWEIKKHDSPNLVGCFRGNGWVVLGLGDDELKLTTALLQRIKDTQRPVDAAKGYWLDAALDWPALRRHHVWTEGADLPVMRLTVQGQRKDNGETYVRPQLVMEFAEPLQFSLKPWNVPTNLIHNPIVSFTALRGLTGGFAQLPMVKALNLNPLPDQAFIWAMDQIPYETCLAAPVTGRNATNYLRQIEPGIMPWVVKLLTTNSPSLQAAWTGEQLLITGAPLVAGFVRAIREPDSDYVIAGLMPSPKRTVPFPAGLLSELNSKPNLLVYDWELTGLRLKQWQSLVQMYSIVEREKSDLPESVTSKWEAAIEPKLGNSGTEVTLSGPKEITVIRNAGLGLTSFEITLLTYWFNSPNFPLTYEHESIPNLTGPGKPTNR